MKMTHITKRTIVDLSGLDWMKLKKRKESFLLAVCAVYIS